MIIQNKGQYMTAHMQLPRLSQQARTKLLGLANEDTEDELLEMLEEAEAAANPVALFGVCAVSSGESSVTVCGVELTSVLVRDKLSSIARCFPYIVTCGVELENWSRQYKYDPLAEFWAEEIKKAYLHCILGEFLPWVKEHYHTGGHLAALNPGSLKDWPVSGQEQLFAILGGREFVQDTIGVFYTESFLMQPTKTVSGIAFESGTYYENCQYCPLEKCPGRRAKRIAEE